MRALLVLLPLSLVVFTTESTAQRVPPVTGVDVAHCMSGKWSTNDERLGLRVLAFSPPGEKPFGVGGYWALGIGDGVSSGDYTVPNAYSNVVLLQLGNPLGGFTQFAEIAVDCRNNGRVLRVTSGGRGGSIPEIGYMTATFRREEGREHWLAWQRLLRGW